MKLFDFLPLLEQLNHEMFDARKKNNMDLLYFLFYRKEKLYCEIIKQISNEK